MHRTLRRTALALLLGCGLAPFAAHADGEYLQLDLGPEDSTAVVSFERNGVSAGALWSRYTDGGAVAFSLTGSRQVTPWDRPVTLRLGPTLRFDDGASIGAKLVAESYTSTGWGGVFAIGEINSIDWSYFSMLEATHQTSGLGLALVLTGDDTGYAEQSLVASKRLGRSDWRLRMGYGFDAGEIFVGVALNTF
ncbi:hypothetical protein [Limimaricola soesokkakensis]|uniref:hypothetical protein n=1 Tax=Limimaricola soesokkakensis TaxID=1343159 RepID=UPI0035144D61